MLRMASSVDLPAPDGPMIVTNSPDLMSSVMRRSSQLGCPPRSMVFSTSLSVMIGSPRVGSGVEGAEAEEKRAIGSGAKEVGGREMEWKRARCSLPSQCHGGIDASRAPGGNPDRGERARGECG